MKTPIISFIEEYIRSDAARLHMPGHKGRGDGPYAADITEIPGADSLYHADGIISESERIASELFGAHTFYSAEGSSLAVRTMVHLVAIRAAELGRAPFILAGRNAHSSFVSALALTDVRVEWLLGEEDSYLCCTPSAEAVAARLALCDPLPDAVYLTSPDYLGNRCDIGKIAEACHEKGVLLLVDNAHGAYLKFLERSQHPIDLGADMCCDSAHKTLPVLTGAGYLHVSRNAPPIFRDRAKQAMALFGSTSPSYLILASLDRANALLAESYPHKLAAICGRIKALKERITQHGYTLTGDEPMKITLCPKSFGYTGEELCALVARAGVIAEFCDRDHLVFMPSTDSSEEELCRLERALTAIPRREQILERPPILTLPKAVFSPREAILSAQERIPCSESLGRVMGEVTVGCPPAVPIAVSGERIDEGVLSALIYYGTKHCLVLK